MHALKYQNKKETIEHPKPRSVECVFFHRIVIKAHVQLGILMKGYLYVIILRRNKYTKMADRLSGGYGPGGMKASSR